MKKSSQTKPALVNQSPEVVQGILTSLALDLDRIIKEGVYSYLADGMRFVINLLLEAEVKGLCGERYKHDPEREANRWGSEPGTAIVNGTKERIKKPRVRSASDGKEIRLATYEVQKPPRSNLNTKLLESCYSLERGKFQLSLRRSLLSTEQRRGRRKHPCFLPIRA